MAASQPTYHRETGHLLRASLLHHAPRKRWSQPLPLRSKSSSSYHPPSVVVTTATTDFRVATGVLASYISIWHFFTVHRSGLLYACGRLAAGKMDESTRTLPVHAPRIKKKHRGKKHKKHRSSSTVSIQQSTPAREAQQRKLSMYSVEVNESSRVNELPNTPLAGQQEHVCV